MKIEIKIVLPNYFYPMGEPSSLPLLPPLPSIEEIEKDPNSWSNYNDGLTSLLNQVRAKQAKARHQNKAVAILSTLFNDYAKEKCGREFDPTKVDVHVNYPMWDYWYVDGELFIRYEFSHGYHEGGNYCREMVKFDEKILHHWDGYHDRIN